VTRAAKETVDQMDTQNFRTMLCALLLVGCGGNGVADAGLADAPVPGPCAMGAPGVRVHLNFGSPYVEVVSWNDAQPLALTTAGSVKTFYAVDPGVVDAERHAVVAVDYPAATIAGPANAQFSARAQGIDHWGGVTDFTADPAACVDVEVNVLYFAELPDAGLDAAL
jgi:hypothetical protein